jgi:hypothetical protein
MAPIEKMMEMVESILKELLARLKSPTTIAYLTGKEYK